MIRRHESALARALDHKARILLRVGKEFATGNQAFTATNQDDDTHMPDIDKILGMDIPSGDTESAEV
jgi:hypothetical protein